MEREHRTNPVDFVPSATSQMCLQRRGTGSDANVANVGAEGRKQFICGRGV